MICVECDHPKSLVLDSRKSKEKIWRRRECLGCGHTYTTYELLLSKPDVKRILYTYDVSGRVSRLRNVISIIEDHYKLSEYEAIEFVADLLKITVNQVHAWLGVRKIYIPKKKLMILEEYVSGLGI